MAFKQALGEVRGIQRYGTGFAPLDEVRHLWDIAASVLYLTLGRRYLGQ